MAVTTMRDRWTDERLDDLNGKVGDGFRRVDDRLVQIDRRFEQVDQRFVQVDLRFSQVEARLDTIQRTMTHGFIALFGTQITLFLGTLGFIAVH
ncbi:MAG TPA: hypothetical protein VGI73_03725 [Solirubrobacterales bacterium]|jgi:hypothetical protein